MLTLQMLPAARGDCIWLTYGSPPCHVIIDGGLNDTTPALMRRLEQARRVGGSDALEIELLVVTHIDNDHIQGVIELLRNLPSWAHIKDIWFNGRPQLLELSSTPVAVSENSAESELMGSGLLGGQADEPVPDTSDVAADLLGPREGDELSQLLEGSRFAWNHHPLWMGKAVVTSSSGHLPSATLEGGLKLTLLGPSRVRLERMWKVWRKAMSGKDETEDLLEGQSELLGHHDSWPPVWKEGEESDTSAANGSSISLLAEFAGHAILLAGDAFAKDIVEGLSRLMHERGLQSREFPLSAFKLSHHGSHRNLTRSLLEKIRCGRYLISTDGSGHFHPDQQALLRILRYSRVTPELHFNYLSVTTRPWRGSMADVVDEGFQSYETYFPDVPEEGLILHLP